jgi:hypothetical protein
MPNTDPSEELGRLALAELRELRKLLVGNGSIGLFEQVRNNDDEIKRIWKAFAKLSKAIDKRDGRAKDGRTEELRFLGVRLQVIGNIVIAIVAVMGVALDVFF